MKEIARLHGVPKEIVSNKDSKFTSNFCRGLFKAFGTNLNFSTTYYPKSYVKIKRNKQIIEDMLRMYAMDLGALKICYGDSILLLPFKINTFEELINYLERR